MSISVTDDSACHGSRFSPAEGEVIIGPAIDGLADKTQGVSAHRREEQIGIPVAVRPILFRVFARR